MFQVGDALAYSPVTPVKGCSVVVGHFAAIDGDTIIFAVPNGCTSGRSYELDCTEGVASAQFVEVEATAVQAGRRSMPSRAAR